MLRPPIPVVALDLFPRERRALLDPLDTVRPDDWTTRLASGEWAVKDVVGHLLGDDLGPLARGQPSRRHDLRVDGPSGGEWTVRREPDGWLLWLGEPDEPTTRIGLDEQTAWRTYVRGRPADEIAGRATIEGDIDLAARLLHTFALVS
jgi:hypothetical protein